MLSAERLGILKQVLPGTSLRNEKITLSGARELIGLALEVDTNTPSCI